MTDTAHQAPDEAAEAAPASTELDPIVAGIARLAVQAVLDRKGEDVAVLDVTGRTSICDALVLVTGSHARHVNALAEGVVKAWKTSREAPPIGVEGTESGRWVLIDLGDVIVHIFDGPMRGYYDLDGLWMDARAVGFDEIGVEAPEQDDGEWDDDDYGFEVE
jgi:ribosome-associated protein